MERRVYVLEIKAETWELLTTTGTSLERVALAPLCGSLRFQSGTQEGVLRNPERPGDANTSGGMANILKCLLQRAILLAAQ